MFCLADSVFSRARITPACLARGAAAFTRSTTTSTSAFFSWSPSSRLPLPKNATRMTPAPRSLAASMLCWIHAGPRGSLASGFPFNSPIMNDEMTRPVCFISSLYRWRTAASATCSVSAGPPTPISTPSKPAFSASANPIRHEPMRIFPARSAPVASASHAEAQAPPANPATLARSIARRFIVRSPVQSRSFIMFRLPLRDTNAHAAPVVADSAAAIRIRSFSVYRVLDPQGIDRGSRLPKKLLSAIGRTLPQPAECPRLARGIVPLPTTAEAPPLPSRMPTACPWDRSASHYSRSSAPPLPNAHGLPVGSFRFPLQLHNCSRNCNTECG